MHFGVPMGTSVNACTPGTSWWFRYKFTAHRVDNNYDILYIWPMYWKTMLETKKMVMMQECVSVGDCYLLKAGDNLLAKMSKAIYTVLCIRLGGGQAPKEAFTPSPKKRSTHIFLPKTQKLADPHYFWTTFACHLYSLQCLIPKLW